MFFGICFAKAPKLGTVYKTIASTGSCFFDDTWSYVLDGVLLFLRGYFFLAEPKYWRYFMMVDYPQVQCIVRIKNLGDYT